MDRQAEAVMILGDVQWSATAPDGTPCCPICRGGQAGGHRSDCRLAGVIGSEAVAARRWRHRKRGTTYTEIGHALLQHSGGPLDDQAVMVVYRAEADGTLGVRSLLEFSDGRFERLT